MMGTKRRREAPDRAGLDEAQDEAAYRQRFLASIQAGLADADAGDVVDSDELLVWLAARRSARNQS